MIYLSEGLKEITFSGFDQFEEGGFWSNSKYASLLIPIEPKKYPFGIQLVVEPFLITDKHTKQSIDLFCNGLFVLGHVSTKIEKEILFFEVHPSVSVFGTLKLDFKFDNAVTPSQLGDSKIMRELSYKLYELQIIN
jgi:hypothetical protein